jgi:geranylgeranyl diphosphate synthase type II
MIRLKTAVLLGFSLELGGMLGGASEQACRQLFRIGESIGISFQLMDDLLDVYAEQEKFGKKVGGDILCNKKTFLLINARRQAKGDTAQELEHWLQRTSYAEEEKVEAVTRIYNQLNIRRQTEDRINHYFSEAFRLLDQLEVDRPQALQELKDFMNALIHRQH